MWRSWGRRRAGRGALFALLVAALVGLPLLAYRLAGADPPTDIACDIDGVGVSYGVGFAQDPPGFRVSQVILTGVAPSCAGASASVSLYTTPPPSGTAIASGTATVDTGGGSVPVDVSPDPLAQDVNWVEVVLAGGTAPTVPECGGIKVDRTYSGSDGPDTITGSNFNDLMSGNGGDDQLYGGNNKDCLLGGPGNDRLYGENGNDVLLGGDGNDSLYGGAGNDVLYGGPGNDTLDGGPGNDTCYVQPGETSVNCEAVRPDPTAGGS